MSELGSRLSNIFDFIFVTKYSTFDPFDTTGSFVAFNIPFTNISPVTSNINDSSFIASRSLTFEFVVSPTNCFERLLSHSKNYHNRTLPVCYMNSLNRTYRKFYRISDFKLGSIWQQNRITGYFTFSNSIFISLFKVFITLPRESFNICGRDLRQWPLAPDIATFIFTTYSKTVFLKGLNIFHQILVFSTCGKKIYLCIS